MKSVRVMMFDTGRIETVDVAHWITRQIGHAIGGLPQTIQEPDWSKTLPGYRVEGVLERGYDYVAIKR